MRRASPALGESPGHKLYAVNGPQYGAEISYRIAPRAPSAAPTFSRVFRYRCSACCVSSRTRSWPSLQGTTIPVLPKHTVTFILAPGVVGEDEHDALAAHLDAELNIDEEDIVSPWNAAVASALAFTVGAVLPLLAILLPPEAWRIPVTFVAVLAALGLTGWLGAHLGGAPQKARAALRVVVGGALALAATFAVGSLLGVTGVV